MSALAERFQAVRASIDARLTELGRLSDEVTLIVVTKNHPDSLARQLYELGSRDFGENRDQEAAPKAAALADCVGLNWHFVGQLQSNKVRSVLGYAKSIHSLDRASLLKSLAVETERLARSVDVFIQLNLTDDQARGGVAVADLEPFAEQVLAQPNLVLRGVMGVAALERDPRIDFETIWQASTRLRALAPEASAISAGMSHDFLQALEFGATHLRIGTAITGNRNL
jgi:pyridoxal phosphate enzyme (YggS family)